MRRPRHSQTWLDRVRHVLEHPNGLLPHSPSGIINCARTWVEGERRHRPADIRRGPAACCWEVEPARIRILPPPLSAPGGEPAGAPQRLLVVERAALFFLRQARLLGTEGTVISSDNRVFAEFTYVDDPGGIGSHDIFRRRRFRRPERLGGSYATLTYPSSFAYAHWIIESLPRLRFLGPYLDSLDGVFVPGNLEAPMRESLVELGVREEQLVPLHAQSHYVVERLLVPQFCAGLNVPEWAPAFLRESLFGSSADEGPPEGRLYISRADAAKRRLRNEDELLPILADQGFERIELRSLGFRSQARAFFDAAVVVGPHGAGLANAAFCRPGVRLLELLPDPEPPHLFYSVVTGPGGEYWFLHGETVPDQPDIAPVHRDFTVRPEALRAALERLCGARPTG